MTNRQPGRAGDANSSSRDVEPRTGHHQMVSSATPENPARPTGSGETSLADVTERLFARFDGRLRLTAIARVVRGCRRELDTTPGPVLPEMLERLAHERLTHLARQGSGAKIPRASTIGDRGDTDMHTDLAAHPTSRGP